MATSPKPSHDLFGLGLGLLSWIFPDVSIWVKITVTVVVIGLILFLRMSETKRDRALNAVVNVSDNVLTNLIVPSIGGGFRGLFASLIVVVILDHFFHVRLIHHESIDAFNSGSGSGGIVYLFLHTINNLNSAGTIVVIMAVMIGAFSKIEDAKNTRKEILLNSVVTEYAFATFKGASRFLWIESFEFDFSYNGKTYRHREYATKKRIDPLAKLYRIKFYPTNPKIAKIVWDNPLPTIMTPPPITEDSTK